MYGISLTPNLLFYKADKRISDKEQLKFEGEIDMKKFAKIIAALMAAVCILSSTGCATAPQSMSETVKIEKIEQSGLKQLCADLNKDKLIPEEATVMQSDVIGAEGGYRFAIQLDGGNALLEIYEFNSDKLSDTASKIISDIKESGKFNMLGISDVYAELSDNDKYMMIYNDPKSTGDNPDKAHKERRDKITKIFDKAK